MLLHILLSCEAVARHSPLRTDYADAQEEGDGSCPLLSAHSISYADMFFQV